MPTPVKNLMLLSLSGDDLTLITPYLEAFELRLGEILYKPEGEIEYVYFLDSGIVSVILMTADGRKLEVGIYGRDGFGGTPVLLSGTTSPFQHLVQHAGSGHRIASTALRMVFERHPTILHSLLKYVHIFSVQVAHTALSNGSFVIEERLARWLVMCGDRAGTSTLTLTHEFLSMMLAVRRSGVTDAIHILEGRGLIRAGRGRIEVLDRARLRRIAGESYGGPEREHEKLVGPWLHS